MTSSSLPSDEGGRIITFYSYKGGTGRTMALANVAWLLASGGKRVLMIDWDLEAPGLHRYFQPLLADPELTDARGIVDWVADVSAAARDTAGSADDASGLIASAGSDGSVRVWDPGSGELVAVLEGHEGSVFSVAWGPDDRLASGGLDGSVRVWDVGSGESVAVLEGHRGRVLSVAWGPDGGLVSGGNDGSVRLWDADSGELVAVLEGHEGAVLSVAWGADGGLVSGGQDGSVRLWDADSGELVAVLEGHVDAASAVAWGADGGLVSGGLDGSVRMWDTGRREPVAVWIGHAVAVYSMAWGPDDRLASGGLDGSVRVWEAGSGEPSAVLEGDKDGAPAVAWGPDGRLVSGSVDGTVRIWDAGSGELVMVLEGHVGRVSTVAWGPPPSRDEDRWWEPYTTLAGYSEPVQYEFAGGGLVELVPAGRQDSTYASRVNDTDWAEFYEELGGGVILEELRADLAEEYDYVLVDSRTGIADTAGICTVHLPDELVVCFTLNRQSTRGAAAVAASAEAQRRSDDGAPTLRVWPVPTRIDLAEKDRLDTARAAGRRDFDHFLGHLGRSDRRRYWGEVEMIHQSYYAYEEVLAVVADSPGRSVSIRRAMEELTRYLTGDPSFAASELPEDERKRLVTAFLRNEEAGQGSPVRFYLSYPGDEREAALGLVESMREADLDVWWDGDLLPGDSWDEVADRRLAESDCVMILATDGPLRPGQELELDRAEKSERRIVPLFAAAPSKELPESLMKRNGIFLDQADGRIDYEPVIRQLVDLASRIAPRRVSSDPADPQKGRWGGQAEVSGRRLTAEVEPVREDWFETTIRVVRTGGSRLTGDVVFYLPPEYRNPQTVSPVDDQAAITVQGWGAFTVGATTDGGRVHLELDLTTLDDAPPAFLER